jgi:hypothetical protein
MRELVLGCGDRTTKCLSTTGSHEYVNPTTIDINPDLKPDLIFDLNCPTLPFSTNEFDEIHAYELLEHLGTQGDWRFFFRQFEDFWRVLKPGGLFHGSCPRPESPWAWGDPGHTRVIPMESLGFLVQPNYGTPPRTDYRPWYRGDFDIVFMRNMNEHSHGFILQAVKPARIIDVAS